MPHISKKKLKRKVFLKIHEELFRAIARARNSQKSSRLLAELLTPTERIMIAKRLAIIVMLHRGHSSYRIHTTLKVSPSTLTRFSRKFDEEAYRYIQSVFSSARSTQSGGFWDELEKLILMGMPPIAGKGRWKFLFKQ
ncbi:MAG: hypothetical protein HYV67_04210 [Candidatus Taylorbacteria bacterium]|nr:hypothetical protein [Candidatus Taylorbacteria bacterium]